ncbi:hypothetical protein DENSPDRAFT_788720 [Dentipellis sp. KUC8613]|nr:hypothetical protein DENSPDRAFT_788720 [Dentipellis sp. KUC8613]
MLSQFRVAPQPPNSTPTPSYEHISNGPSTIPQRPPKSNDEKLDEILRAIGDADFTLGKFLVLLFTPIKENPTSNKPPTKTKLKAQRTRDSRRQSYVSHFLSGMSEDYKPIDVVKLMYTHPSSRHHTQYEDRNHNFSVSRPSDSIFFARPALSTWALELVVDKMHKESDYLVSRASGLRVCGSHIKKPKMHNDGSHADADPVVSWNIIREFSLEKLESKYKTFAPVTWHVLWRFMQPNRPGSSAGDVVRRYRPRNIVCTSIISEMAFARNQRTNLLAMCRGISLFAMKAHQTVYRVDSCLAQSVAYSTVRQALILMAEGQRQAWEEAIRNGEEDDANTVLDNLQAHAIRREQRIGLENKMIIGTGATAVVMEDCLPGAFDLQPLLDSYASGARKRVTVKSILKNMNVPHLTKIATFHWLDALVTFVPALGVYRPQVRELFSTEAQIHQINPHRLSKIHPLGTNGANECTTQGMKDAVLDFAAQRGITEDTFKKRIRFFSGDGKSFEGLNKIKKYLITQSDDFKALRFLEPILELWHTKWTELSRVCRSHWGRGFESIDPSSLGFLAHLINSPIPPNLKKVDFYPNTCLLSLGTDVHMVRGWELHYNTDNLPKMFDCLEKNNELPSLAALLEIAKVLHERYSTSEAYLRALAPLDHVTRLPNTFPVAQGKGSSTNTHNDAMATSDENGAAQASTSKSTDANGNDDVSQGRDTDCNRGDWVLANTCLLMRDGIWYKELCRAIAVGDTGCVWEILKIFIFTFAGAGNSNYTAYLTEMYCKIEHEYPPATRHALFSNWLVNLTGKPGHFLPQDLMQEHFNFWLEEMAQHKGKEFDDPWYRDVLSMHVYHFLRLKEELAAVVQVAARSKSHTSPHLDNEFLAALRAMREHDVHRYHEGRDFGRHVEDDFARGIILLGKENKLDDYISGSVYEQNNLTDKIILDKDAADASTYMRLPLVYVDGRLLIPS